MKRTLIVVLALALPLAAQTPSATPVAPQNDPSKIIVATVNGEVITQQQLDSLWENAGAKMRMQYEKAGGKAAFLDNYIGKRLIVQEALKQSFESRPEVQAQIEAARESALFDRYVRDVLSAAIVSEGEVKKFYEENKAQFSTPERVKVRHIVITPRGKAKEEARARLQAAATELHQYRVQAQANPQAGDQYFLMKFADVASRTSEDGSREQGGDLGWVAKGALDPVFEEAAFSMKKGTMSGIVETQFGYHLIYVEDRQPAGTETYEQARSSIREFLMSQNAAAVVASVNRLTSELRQTSKVSVFPDRIK
ncbi:MAG TPA: peptidyl-prolyl cis-trans isomerase [Thermoanaerobaculia bacterium]